MNEYKSRNVTLIIVAFILAVGAIISCYLGVYGLAEYKAKKNSINIRGAAEEQIKSDLIIWTGSFSIRAEDLKAGYSDLEADKELVRNYMIEKGVKDSDLIFSSISTNENYMTNEYGSYTNEIKNYTLTQTVTIKSSEVDKITELSRNATELINEGVKLESYAPEYHYTNLADLKVSLLAEATADATKRAEMIAENANCKLGKLKRANIDDIQIQPLYSNRMNYYDDYYYYISNDTSSLEKEVTVVVYCSFEID